MIKNSSNKTKFCAKCKQEVWSFEKRKNINKTRVEHLKGQCRSVNNNNQYE